MGLLPTALLPPALPRVVLLQAEAAAKAAREMADLGISTDKPKKAAPAPEGAAPAAAASKDAGKAAPAKKK